MKKLKIVMISTLWERTPPALYGGTERIVSYLTEELVKRDHDVTLFATGDSQTKARLISTYPRALYRDKIPWTSYYDNLSMCSQAFEHAQKNKVDIIHSHDIYNALAFSNLTTIPAVYTIHSNIQKDVIADEKIRMLSNFPTANFVTISNSQRKILNLNYLSTVYNGIPVEKFNFNANGGDFLLWLGRVSGKKGTAEAIQVAKKLKKRLILAGKIDMGVPKDMAYFEKEIKPHLKKGKIDYVGEADHQQKNKLFSQAKAVINLINWDEPFGLVPVEANACGTPVVATKRGAMTEIIKNNNNGFLVNSVEEAAAAVKNIYNLSSAAYRQLRLKSRNHAENNFTVQKMVDGYEMVYQKMLKKS